MGQPEDLSDLHNHQYVLISAINDPQQWRAFSRPGNTTEKILLSGDIMTNSSQGLQAFVKAGAGIAVLPEIFIRDSLK